MLLQEQDVPLQSRDPASKFIRVGDMLNQQRSIQAQDREVEKAQTLDVEPRRANQIRLHPNACNYDEPLQPSSVKNAEREGNPLRSKSQHSQLREDTFGLDDRTGNTIWSPNKPNSAFPGAARSFTPME